MLDHEHVRVDGVVAAGGVGVDGVDGADYGAVDDGAALRRPPFRRWPPMRLHRLRHAVRFRRSSGRSPRHFSAGAAA